MIAVINTPTFVHLAEMNRLDVLSCFRQVFLPDEVYLEISRNTDQRNSGVNAALSAGLSQRTVTNRLALSLLRGYLGAGEAACVVLACEVSADVVILDDRRARLQAQAQGLKVIGTIGLLMAADALGRVEFPEAFDELKGTGFWIHTVEQEKALSVWQVIRDSAPNALHQAAKDGDVERIERLLSQGVDINTVDRHGRTALHIVAEAEMHDILEILVEKGAHANVVDKNGLTPLAKCYDSANFLLTAIFAPIIANFRPLEGTPFWVPDAPLDVAEILTEAVRLQEIAYLDRDQILRVEWVTQGEDSSEAYYVYSLENGDRLFVSILDDGQETLLAAVRTEAVANAELPLTLGFDDMFLHQLFLNKGRAFQWNALSGVPVYIECDSESLEAFSDCFFEALGQRPKLWGKIRDQYDYAMSALINALEDDDAEAAYDEDDPETKRKLFQIYLNQVLHQ